MASAKWAARPAGGQIAGGGRGRRAGGERLHECLDCRFADANGWEGEEATLKSGKTDSRTWKRRGVLDRREMLFQAKILLMAPPQLFTNLYGGNRLWCLFRFLIINNLKPDFRSVLLQCEQRSEVDLFRKITVNRIHSFCVD